MKYYKYHQPDHLRRNYPLLKNKKGKDKVGLTNGSGCLSSEDSGDDVLVVSDGAVEFDGHWTPSLACS